MNNNLTGKESKFFFVDESTGEKIPMEEIKTLTDEEFEEVETLQKELEKEQEQEESKQKPNPVYVPKHVAHRKKRWKK